MSTPAADHRPLPPGLRRLLRRDWPAFGLLALAGLCWLCVAALWLFTAIWPPGNADDRNLITILTVVGVVAGIVAACTAAVRLLRLQRLFVHGERVTGRVVQIGENSEDIAFAVVEYTFNGGTHRVTNVIESLPDRDQLKTGDEIDVVVDPKRPSRGYLAGLFETSEGTERRRNV
jgi:hypothetical protein